MAIYPLNTYCKGGKVLFPHSSSYTEEYAQRVCAWYLTDSVYRDDHGRLKNTYRLRSCKPRTFADFMQYDIQCPRCNQRLRPVQNALNHHDLALYVCPNCDSKK